jgi:UDP-N-acetylglucosamine:LPS N-acetylglucosamine transferase
VQKGAACMVADGEAKDKAIATVMELVQDENRRTQLIKNISMQAVLNADEHIAREILKSIA